MGLLKGLSLAAKHCVGFLGVGGSSGEPITLRDPEGFKTLG